MFLKRLRFPWWHWTLFFLAGLAAVISIRLTGHFFSGGNMPGCNAGSSCDVVLQSPWSMIAGLLPVSSLAVGVYLAALTSLFFIGDKTEKPVRELAWTALVLLAGAITGSAAWFTIVQKWYIGSFCPYCMTAHISGFLFSVIVLFSAFRGRIGSEKTLPARRILLSLTAGLLLAAILVLAQVLIKPRATYKEGEVPVELPSVPEEGAPILGSEKAPYKIALLFDYNCGHCRKIHGMLQEVIDRYHGKVSFQLCPTPLNTHCNDYVPRDVDAFQNSCELARIGLAVWKSNRSLYPEYEKWVFSVENSPNKRGRSTDEAMAKAIALLGEEAFDAALSDPWISTYLHACTQLFGHTLQSGKGGIPKMVYQSRWVIPQPENAEQLISILQTTLLIPKP